MTTLSTKTIVFGATNPKGQYDPDQCNTVIQKIYCVGFATSILVTLLWKSFGCVETKLCIIESLRVYKTAVILLPDFF